MSDFRKKLKALDACSDAVEWVGRKTLKTAWAKCERGDWLLWYAFRAGVDRKLLVLAACDCAETALQYVPEGELRPAQAIQAARNWCAGTGTAKAASAAARTAEAAAKAARAAGAAEAAEAAEAAAEATAEAAAETAAEAAAETTAHKTCADLVRVRIPYALLEQIK